MTKVSAYAMLAGMIVLSALSVLVFRLQITRMGSPAELIGKLLFVVQALLTPLAVATAMASFGVAFVFWTFWPAPNCLFR